MQEFAFAWALAKAASAPASGRHSNVDVGLGAGAVAATGALGAILPAGPQKVLERSTKDIYIFYTDPSRGAGHFAQGRALHEELLRRGVRSHLVNFDTEFGDTKLLAEYTDSFNKFLRGERSFVLHLPHHIKFYRNLPKHKELQRIMAGDNRIVLANAGLQPFVSEFKRPVMVLHTDQAPWAVADYASDTLGRTHQHIAPRAAADALGKQHPTIAKRMSVVDDLPIRPRYLKTGTLREPGRLNLTVSGGALGLNTHMMATALVSSGRLPPGTVVHAVAGNGKEQQALLQVLENSTKGKAVQVRAYGFAELASMMSEADVNVLRPHGTSITEATAAGKPFVLFLPSANKQRGMDILNARATQTHVGAPLAFRETVGDTVAHVIKNKDAFTQQVQRRATGATQGSSQVADTVLSHRTYTTFKRSGRLWTTARVGLAATALGTAGVLGVRAYRGHVQPQVASTNGFWRRLGPGERGKGEGGAPEQGRTWIRKKRG